MRHDLHAVADAEDGHIELEQFLSNQRRLAIVHTGRSSREDNALRPVGLNAREGSRIGKNLGIDVGLSDTAGYQLGVLGAEVEDENAIMPEFHRAAFSGQPSANSSPSTRLSYATCLA